MLAPTMSKLPEGALPARDRCPAKGLYLDQDEPRPIESKVETCRKAGWEPRLTYRRSERGALAWPPWIEGE